MMHELNNITVEFAGGIKVEIDMEGDVTFPDNFMDEATVKFILQLMTNARSYIDDHNRQ